MVEEIEVWGKDNTKEMGSVAKDRKNEKGFRSKIQMTEDKAGGIDTANLIEDGQLAENRKIHAVPDCATSFML